MVVRINVKIKFKDKFIITSAIANSGYETDEPEVILPIKVAENLGIYPKLPNGVIVEEYLSIGRRVIETFLIRNALEVLVLSNDRNVGPIIANAVITPGEDEVILSDKALDELKICLIKPGEGLWRFIDDKNNVIRKSVRAVRWT